jgi:CubicO group peptidase (beta-lactamase class C family)
MPLYTMVRCRCVLILLIFSSCTSAQREVQVADGAATKLDPFLNETLNRLQVPGLTIAVTRNDSVIYSRAFGYTNVNTKKPMKAENIFHWASVSKTFVATAIMQLREKGQIKLDEKLVTYLPYFRQKDPDYRNITIRQMLNHTSGIGDVDDYEWHKPQYDSGALERFVKSTAKDKMIFAPGEDMTYSNTAYEMLGDVVAKVSGMSFETYIQKNIFDPLEMNSTSFLYPEIPDSLRVSGHQWAAGPVVAKHYPYNRMHGPSSTLNSSVPEMTHYAMAHLNRGMYKGKRILADSIYNLWWTNSINLANKPKIGFAWWLDERHGLKTVSHSGGDTGFRSFFMLVPERNMSIMLVSNYELVRTYDLAAAVLDILLDKEPNPVRRHIGLGFVEVLKAQGLDAAKSFVKTTREDSVKRSYYLWDENDAAYAYAGYLCLEQKMLDEAIAVFKFNLEQFPKSAWANAHLATGYAEAGQRDLARQHFQKAIELQPEEQHFRDELRKVGGK